jgi:hypothetical protein
MFSSVDLIIDCNNARIDHCLDPKLHTWSLLISSTKAEAVRALRLQL